MPASDGVVAAAHTCGHKPSLRAEVTRIACAELSGLQSYHRCFCCCYYHLLFSTAIIILFIFLFLSLFFIFCELPRGSQCRYIYACASIVRQGSRERARVTSRDFERIAAFIWNIISSSCSILDGDVLFLYNESGDKGVRAAAVSFWPASHLPLKFLLLWNSPLLLLLLLLAEE